MYRHHFAICLICLLMFFVGAQHVAAQSQLAQDAYAIFEASCLNCHGPDGAFRETLLMEHGELIDGGTVVPGNPNASELYKRLLGPTENGAQMPFNLPQLTAKSIEVVRRWILAGAPDWTTAPITTRRFISPTEILKAIDTHVKTISPFDRPFTRYFTMTHLYNAGVPPDILAEYRKALAKLVNSLSWGLEIVNPQPINMQQTIFYIDLRHYEWDRNAGWAQIEQAYPYHVEFNAPAQTALRNQLSLLQTTLNTDVPVVNVDWFIAVASSPPLYNNLLSLPERDIELEDRLEVDVVDNILTAPGIRVWRAGFTNSGVSNHNRVVDRHTSRYGAYWKSYDFAGSSGTRNVFTHPFAFTHDGGEVIFNLPNGLQGYYLVDGDGFRLDAAPISIVSNPAASDPTVRNGLSCIGCHTEGMKEIDDEVRAYIESDTNPAYNKPHALQLYVADSTMDSKVNNDRMRYQGALQLTGGDLDDIEPVSRFHEEFQRSVDAEHAAAAVGLPTETFLEKIRTNAGLQDAGLLVLDSENGTVKRDSWTSSFQDVIHALDYPQDVGDVPVETRPDLLPGRPVNVPDPNLKALLEKTLDVRKLRADAMAKLTSLKAKGKDISDLTGLESAVNLEEIWLSDNPVSDLSPLAKCTNLKRLFLWGTPVKDLSPLAKLSKLEVLEHRYPWVSSDLSPLANLTNLKVLRFYIGEELSDLTHLAQLTNLIRLDVRHGEVRDLTPLAGLTNLEHLDLHDNAFSDISPLENLTKLRNLELSGNRLSNLFPLKGLVNLEWLIIRDTGISDVSPLAGLKNLRVLHAHRNDISDVSPLKGLTNLYDLNLSNNEISDVSHLRRLINLRSLNLSHNSINDIDLLTEFLKNTNITWHHNLGFPADAPKIEGPWLWVVLPNTRLESDRDLLAEISAGTASDTDVGTHGATEGESVGDTVWNALKLAPSGNNNLRNMLNLPHLQGVVYGTISIYTLRRQDTTMYVGNDEGLKVWLNGVQVYEVLRELGAGSEYEDFFPVTLKRGRNVLLVAVYARGPDTGASFGFEQGTEYIAAIPSVGYSLPDTRLHVSDTFTLDIIAENVFDLAGWQFDLTFDPAVLEANGVNEGDFLKSDGGNTFFPRREHRQFRTGKIITVLIAGRITRRRG